MAWQVVHAVVEDQTVFGNEKLVAIYLANHCHKDGTGAYPSVATLARETGLSRPTVTKCLAALVAKGFIQVDQRSGQHHATRYSFLFGVTQPTTSLAADGSQPLNADSQPLNLSAPAAKPLSTNQENLFRETNDSDFNLSEVKEANAELRRTIGWRP